MREIKKVIKLNVDYLNFIIKIVKNKEIMNKDIIKKRYEKELNCVFNNRKRINMRNNRKELINIKEKIIKENNINLDVYNKVECEFIKLDKNKNLKYYEVNI